MIRTKLEYCSVVWDYDRDCTDEKIESELKKFLYNFRQLDLIEEGNSYKVIYVSIVPLLKRRKINDCLFMFKAIANCGYSDDDISDIGYRVPYANIRHSHKAAFVVLTTNAV